MNARKPDPLVTEAPGTSAAAGTSPGGSDPTIEQPTGKQPAVTSRLAGTIPVAEVPKSIGGYTIHGVLGRGGTGVVYKALDVELKRTVALKMLWAGPDASEDELVRFRGEAEMVAQLQHPNIVQIYDIGQHEGHPYLALEFVEGGSLDAAIRGQPQSPRRAAEIVEILARAMHAAHDQNIIHRDLKPANVLVTASGHFKITDFGLAKRLGDSIGFTRTGDVMGTPSYMAPEQAAGQTREFGPAVDVYALGAILYELLTGRPPFKGASVPDTLDLVRHEEPASPSRLVPKLHRDLSTICLKCLRKSPARRYESAEALADDLRRWLDGDPIQARPLGRFERWWLTVKRRPLATAVTACAILCAAALVFSLWSSERARNQARLAEQEKELREEEKRVRVELEGQFDRSMTALNDITNVVMTGSALDSRKQLTDLHNALLRYYSDLVASSEVMRWQQRGRLATACLSLGDLMSKTGRKAQAIEAYRKAGAIAVDLLKEDNQKIEVRELLARTQLECGKQLRDLGRSADANEEYQAAKHTLSEVIELAPQRAKALQVLAEVWHQIGILEGDSSETKKKALGSYEQGRKIREDLASREPDNKEYRRDLARSYGYMGDVQLDLGHLPDADRSYWESHNLRKKLTDQPEDRMQLGRSLGNFGNYQYRIRAYATAGDFFEQSREAQQKLVNEFPAFTDYRADLAGTLCRLAEVGLCHGRSRDEIRHLLEEARRHYSDLAAVDPGNTTVQFGLVETNVLLAMTLFDTDRETAVQHLEAAKTPANKLAQQRKDARDSYYLAALAAMDRERPSDSAAERQKLADEATKQLQEAFKRGFRRKHPDDVRRERAFRSIADTDAFDDALRGYETSLKPAKN